MIEKYYRLSIYVWTGSRVENWGFKIDYWELDGWRLRIEFYEPGLSGEYRDLSA